MRRLIQKIIYVQEHLDGKQATLISLSDDIRTLAYEKTRSNYSYLGG
jgi:hypothetical protein